MKLRLAVALLMMIAVIRVALSWTSLSQTADEPAHVAAGMEVLVQHKYTIHLENTPLPRIVLSLIPWLGGTEYSPGGSVTEQGNSVIYSRGEYLANLVRIRAGNLVFFFIAMLFMWLWARNAIGTAGGLVALFFFTTQPVNLGHAGLATTDMAAVAGIAAALYAWSKWLEAPAIARAVAAGAAYGFAINCKLSAVVFVPAAWLAMFGLRWLAAAFESGAGAPQSRARSLFALTLTGMLVTWAGYGFGVGSMNSVEPVSDAFVPQWLASTPILAPRLFRGVVKLMATDRRGHPQFLFGMSSMHGWWWYFPAVLALKTTLATLIAAAVALIKRFRAVAEPVAAALAILLVSMTTHINVGIRYILPIFVPLSILAAAGVLELWPRRRVLAVVLVAWQSLTGISHPDYFVYFNELAGREPSRYLLDSDLDWGQDLLRLEDELRRRNVQSLGFKFFGPADLRRHNLPPWTEIRIDRPMKGWVAISENFYNGIWYDGYHPRRYPWLVNEKPVARIGKSIRLYFIP